jgi:hypothetical protein
MFTSRRLSLGLLVPVIVVIAAAAGAPSASAATQRYASPDGGGTDCSAVQPCSITEAIPHASPGDEVIIQPGDYPLATTLSPPSDVTIHGVAGKPRPRLLFTGPGQNELYLSAGTTLRYVELDQSVPMRVLYAYSSTVEQVVARGAGDGWATAIIQNSTIRDSTVVSSGAGGMALLTEAYNGIPNKSTYRNVTAIATGTGGVAVEASVSYHSNASINMVNTIAYAGPGALSLLAETDSSSGAYTSITYAHSAYQSADASGVDATLVNGGGNHLAQPSFVDAAAGDYRQAAGAWTIDAGLDDPANGDLDVDGDPRRVGTTDIGADEFVPPAPATSEPPTPTTPATPATPAAQPFAGVKLVSPRLTLAGRIITVRLSCPAATAGRCSGRTKLSARRTILGRARFSIAAGSRATVRVPLSRAGRRLFARTPRLRGRAANVARNAAGQTKTNVAAVTIRRRTR